MSGARFSRALILGGTLAFALLAGRTITSQSAPSGDPEAAKVPNPVPASKESIAAGQQVYEKNCTPCHGWDGSGGPPIGTAVPANLTDDKWDHGSTDGEIFYTIRHGVPPDLVMRPWDQFSDTDVWNIINYVRTLHEPAKK